MKIALVGNPNCGKTTLFNRLTGSKQKVGNWPGVTVEQKYGYFVLENTNVEVVDLPGLYSMEQVEPSQDEQIACDFLKQNDADIIVNIIDAANLQRNLVLTSQLKELGKPILVVANMVDVATQRGRQLDLAVYHNNLSYQWWALMAPKAQDMRIYSTRWRISTALSKPLTPPWHISTVVTLLPKRWPVTKR